MRPTRVLLMLVLLVACEDRDAASERQRVDPSLLTNSSGEVELTDGSSLSYVITSERYRKWDAAQRALSRTVTTRFGQILNPRSPSESSINRAVAYLEGQPAARNAIVRAGMTVRDFVVLTVALEQQMQLAESRGEAPPVYSPDATMDSGYLPVPPAMTPVPQPYPAYPQPYPSYPQPQPVPQYPPTYPPPTPVVPTPVPRQDTVRVDTLVPRPVPVPPVPRETLPRRDSVPRRDTLPPRRDTIVIPPPSDTMPASPPDTLATG